MIVTHPKNLELLKKEARDHSIDLSTLSIQTNEYIPERDIQRVWEPPPSDRYVEYGPEDKDWMRPLGLGRTVEKDMGPLFYEVSMPSFIARNIPIEKPDFGTSALPRIRF